MCSRVIVYGGCGSLGRKCVELLKKSNVWVTSIDLGANDAADQNVLITNLTSWTEQEKEVVSKVESALGGENVDAILCVAGGWAGGNAKSPNLVKSADLMWKQSVWTSTIAAHLATKFMNSGGMLTLPGAAAGTDGTPGMIGYGMAKAAVHQLCKSVAASSSGMPESSTTVCVLPITLDTPMNRKGMPDADFTSWTSLEFVAELLIKWAQGKDRPESGSLLKLVTEGGNTKVVPV